MSLRRLLTRTVTRIPFESDGTDSLGNPIVVWGDAEQVEGYLWKVDLGHEELLRDRDVALSTWRLVVGADQPFNFRDRVEADGETFEVDGTVHPAFNPRKRRVSHKELQLRLIQEGAA